MKKLGKLSINPEKLIQIDELKVLKGGQCEFYVCSCLSPVITWQGFYCSQNEVDAAIDEHCGGYEAGGTCN
jgi:hypothetical protein